MSTPAKILVVDDEEDLRTAAAKVLQRAGYDVASVSSGSDALTHLAAHDADLIVSDLMMPAMDGVELLRQVKQTRPSVKFVILTGAGTVENAVEAMRLGAFDFLQKPLNRAALLDIVAKALAATCTNGNR